MIEREKIINRNELKLVHCVTKLTSHDFFCDVIYLFICIESILKYIYTHTHIYIISVNSQQVPLMICRESALATRKSEQKEVSFLSSAFSSILFYRFSVL